MSQHIITIAIIFALFYIITKKNQRQEEFADGKKDDQVSIVNSESNYYKTTTSSLVVLALIWCSICTAFLYILSGSRLSLDAFGSSTGYGGSAY